MISHTSMGPNWPTSEEWKRRILERIEEVGTTKAELARVIGVSDAAVSIWFHPDTKTNRYVPAIHAALKLPAPPPPESVVNEEIDALKIEIDAAWPHLSDEERRTVAGVVRIAKKG